MAYILLPLETNENTPNRCLNIDWKKRKNMKRLIIPLCSLALVLGMVGVAGALTFTDTEWLFRTYSGVGSDSWYHNTPSDLNVPPDTVNSANLFILAWLVDGSNDYIEVGGYAPATPINNGSWIFGLSFTGIDYKKGSVPVPEPETMLMLGSVLLGLVAVSRKRFKTRN
jgi:hypothetical protein